MRKTNLKEKGITLIALVITIIILLILAGVTLSTALGQNGLFERAKIAGEKYKESEADETEKLREAESEMDKISSTSSSEYKFDPKNFTIGDPVDIEQYGDRVVGYSAGGITDWRFFYRDSNLTYIISNDCIDINNYNEEEYPTCDSIGSIGRNLNPFLENSGKLFNVENELKNVRFVAFLTDENKWKNYCGKGAEFAIGSPTYELWVRSFRSEFNKNGETYKMLYKLDKACGYKYTTYYDEDKERSGLYNCSSSYWLASPGASGPYYEVIYFFTEDDKLDSDDTYDSKSKGARPVVCFTTSNFQKYYSLTPWVE